MLQCTVFRLTCNLYNSDMNRDECFAEVFGVVSVWLICATKKEESMFNIAILFTQHTTFRRAMLSNYSQPISCKLSSDAPKTNSKPTCLFIYLRCNLTLHILIKLSINHKPLCDTQCVNNSQNALPLLGKTPRNSGRQTQHSSFHPSVNTLTVQCIWLCTIHTVHI